MNRFPGEASECDRFGIEAGGSEVIEHYEWIEEQLKKYSNDPSVAWLAITLHYQPIDQTGQKNYLLPLLRKYKVDVIFTAHEHYIEYTNMDPDYKIRYPNSRFGPIINNCTGTEILVADTRHMKYNKGDTLHQFVTGVGGGEEFVQSCPLKDQDGKVWYRSNQNNGAGALEITSKTLSYAFYLYPDIEKFRVTISNMS